MVLLFVVLFYYAVSACRTHMWKETFPADNQRGLVKYHRLPHNAHLAQWVI